MVEQITCNALAAHLAFLKTQGLLDEVLAQELERLTKQASVMSNWTDAERYLEGENYQRLHGGGPVSKVLRTLAYLLEQFRSSAAVLAEKGIRVTRIRLQDTLSGCSTYTGQVLAEGQNEDQAGIVLCRGSFVWDCAAHQMPQTQAAQELGYRCMVSFPEITG